MQDNRASSGRAELHSHTDHSDGSLSPGELVAAAVEHRLSALAITDHDTVSGLAPARAAATDLPLELIAGIEFSANVEDREVHVLGLFIRDTDAALLSAARECRSGRRQRGREILERLADLGIEIDESDIDRDDAGESVGRPHIAAAMVAHGHVSNMNEAFRRYIGINRPAFVPKPTPSASSIIDVLHGAGGLAVLAHPGSSRISDGEIATLVAGGLDGLEVRHPKHNLQQEARLRMLAEQFELLPTSGSDFHGPGNGRTALGDFAVPLDWLKTLRAKAEEYR